MNIILQISSISVSSNSHNN